MTLAERDTKIVLPTANKTLILEDCKLQVYRGVELSNNHSLWPPELATNKLNKSNSPDLI